MDDIKFSEISYGDEKTVSKKEDRKLIIEIETNGFVLPDKFVLETAKQVCDAFLAGDNDLVYPIATECMMLAFLMMVARGVIDHNQLMFRYEGKDYYVNEKAEVDIPVKKYSLDMSLELNRFRAGFEND